MTFPVFAGNSASTGYNLTRSLRFRSSASPYLNRTPATTTNRQIWTWSEWIKLGQLNSYRVLFSAGTGDVTRTILFFDTNNALNFINTDGTNYYGTITTAVFRDPSAWYHIVCAIDTTQATTANRVKLYVNGVQQTATSAYSSGYVPQNANTYVNVNNPHAIGSNPPYGLAIFFDGYMTEVNFIDGQQLAPSSFGETDSTTGVWKPKRYAGTYGTNGFYLPFTDNSALTTSSNVGLGKDFSGNGNYWVTNNISITSGVTYDSMTDVPTLTSATASNFAVLNPLRSTVSGGFSNGNLTGTCESGVAGRGLTSTITLPWTGKWYAEATPSASNSYNWIGITAVDLFTLATDAINTAGQQSVLYYALNGNKYVNGTGTSYGASYTTETIGIAFDGAAGTVTFYKANVSQGSITLPSSTVNYVFCQANAAGQTSSINWNFGQRPFAYTPPTGYVSLNTYNLPTSTIVKGNTVMDATLYTGNGSTQTITNAAGFKPDFVWGKTRNVSGNNMLADSVRGPTLRLISNTGGAEDSGSALTSFNSNGFSVDSASAINQNTNTVVAWQWQAGQGTTSSNTSGTITSTVSVNASAGFSVVTYTGTAINATIGHGLGVAPRLLIGKTRSTTSNWPTYHASLGNTQGVYLNGTNAATTSVNFWNNTSPTSSVFTIGGLNEINTSGQTQVVYAWAPIAGFSQFDSFIGNGSVTGPFVYCGFQPRYILIKNSSGAYSWVIFDTARNTYNSVTNYLLADLSSAEATGIPINVTANGFQIASVNAAYNAAGNVMIYAAFASNPFKNSLAF